MSTLLREIEANFERFSAAWPAELDAVFKELRKSRDKYQESYTQLVSLNAWRNDLLAQTMSPESLAFFLEAQNDALVSHVLGSLGAWRSALQALRGCIENVYCCLYYKDHPVELQLWKEGKHRLGFAELHAYLQHHPQVRKVPEHLTGLDRIKNEYSSLSRAVHGSAPFRMSTQAGETLLWSSDLAKLGAWRARETRTIGSLNLLLLTLFRDELQGARLVHLRTLVGLSVPSSAHAAIKSKLKVTLPVP